MTAPSAAAGVARVPLKAIFAAIFVHILWGGNPVAVKFSLSVFPPMWTAFFRFVLGITCVAVWARLNGFRIWPTRREWPLLALLGVLFCIQIGAMNVGFDMTTASMGSVLIATNPIFAALFAHFAISGDRMQPRKALGLTVAFLGVVVVLIPSGLASGLDVRNWGNLVVLASAALLGARLIYAAKLLQQIDEVRVVIWQMAVALPLFALAGSLAETIRWQHLAWQPIAGIVYQGVLIAGLGFMVMSYLVKRYPPSVMLSFSFVSPIAGVLLSALLLNDTITARVVAGVALVGAGLFLIAKR